MSFFPRSYFAPEASFTPLFRLLDEFDNYRDREVSSSQGGQTTRRATPAFSPRFDVKETEHAYELHGELPGLAKDDVRIEFTEPQTLVVSGRTERSYTSGTPPTGLIEDAQMSGAITEGGEKDTNSHKATVSDEEIEKAKEKGQQQVTRTQKKKEPAERFWVSERSVGEFSRTFSFPSPVEQDAVSANLKDGILSVTVPKAVRQAGRRIAIN